MMTTATQATETIRQFWTRMVMGSIRFTSHDEPLAQRVIDECVRTANEGRPCGTWHALAIVTGRRCFCAKCYEVK